MLFLLAVILPTDILKMNIAYSCFIFLIVTASLIILDTEVKEKCDMEELEYEGILQYIPRFSYAFTFFTLIAVGLPISSLFWSNFVLISAIFEQNFMIGSFVMSAFVLAAVILIRELLNMHSKVKTPFQKIEIEDLSTIKACFLMMVVIILLLSFFNPLWFVFGG